jgi:D-lyxose ketol-isomerase
MHAETLTWAADGASPLVQHLCFVDPSATTVMVGTGTYRAGQDMPDEGFSQRPLREISIILEGAIETETSGKSVRLGAGDLVTIPPNEKHRSRFLEDTKLIYIYFGHRSIACDNDS